MDSAFDRSFFLLLEENAKCVPEKRPDRQWLANLNSRVVCNQMLMKAIEDCCPTPQVLYVANGDTGLPS